MSIIYTTAPVAYDAHGTETIMDPAGYWRRSNGVMEPVRKVSAISRHAQWQIGRYASGLYFTRDLLEWEREIHYGNAIEVQYGSGLHPAAGIIIALSTHDALYHSGKAKTCMYSQCMSSILNACCEFYR